MARRSARALVRVVAVGAMAAMMAPALSQPVASPALPHYPIVAPGTALRFPADHGAHSEFRTEWWYVTGWLKTADGRDLGFQITFFRTRPDIDQSNPSAFAAKQIVMAHAALSDPARGKLLHDQRVSRAGFGLAETSAIDTDIVLDDWSFKRGSDDRFHGVAHAAEFTLDLDLKPTQAILLQGDGGYSRKGPDPTQASYYYSLPHLDVSGTVLRDGHKIAVTGSAWMDHEWSSTLLDPRSAGWDWLALNLDDGGALMAFQVRDAKGLALWAGGSLRNAKGELVRLDPSDIRFTTERAWHSPHTGIDYPVERLLAIGGAITRQWRIGPLFDDQEFDSRSAGGPVYWEGAVQTEGGRGYLELTGYGVRAKN